MIKRPEMALLPTGLKDVLPPDANHEASTGETLLSRIGLSGYERVKPPLVEFEDGLTSGTVYGTPQQSFRLMDPMSQRMMALRSDVTPQVARIATTRLAEAPRPLRLSYSGDVMRVKGSELRPERQFCQVGFELIGPSVVSGDAEVILLAAEALDYVGVENLSVDLNASSLVTAVVNELSLPSNKLSSLLEAIERKDESSVCSIAGESAHSLISLLNVAGSAATALDRLAKISLPPEAHKEASILVEVAELVIKGAPNLVITVDPVEHRSFEYHTGIGFTFFAKGIRGELGRGGRYTLERNGASESATGCTLYLDSVMRAMPEKLPEKRVFIPSGVARAVHKNLMAEGWITIAGLEEVDDVAAEASRLNCSHFWIDNSINSVNF